MSKPATETTKKELVSFLEKVQKKGEISWLITDTHSFDWTEINEGKKKFINEISKMKFRNACVGVFYPENKSTEYTSFKLKRAT